MYARIETARDIELLEDSELVRRLKRGHDDALEVLLRRHREALYRFCCHLMPNREDAEDICQETLARAITRVDSLQAGAAFRSWLFSIARNLSVDSYRTKKRTCPMPDEESMPLPLYGETPHDRIEVSEEHEIVTEALGKLAQSHQKVLVLREVDGLSYAAIAEEMQVSQSAVETLLFRARRRLREEYAKTALPVVALLGGLREMALRFLPPMMGTSDIAKVAITTALVGGTVAAAPHVLTRAHVKHTTVAQAATQVHHRMPAVPGVARLQTAPIPSVAFKVRISAPSVRHTTTHPVRSTNQAQARSVRRQVKAATRHGAAKSVKRAARAGIKAGSSRIKTVPSAHQPMSRKALVEARAVPPSTMAISQTTMGGQSSSSPKTNMQKAPSSARRGPVIPAAASAPAPTVQTGPATSSPGRSYGSAPPRSAAVAAPAGSARVIVSSPTPVSPAPHQGRKGQTQTQSVSMQVATSPISPAVPTPAPTAATSAATLQAAPGGTGPGSGNAGSSASGRGNGSNPANGGPSPANRGQNPAKGAGSRGHGH